MKRVESNYPLVEIIREKTRNSYCRVWNGWSLPQYNMSHYGDMLVPDVSRVYRLTYEGVDKDEEYLVNLFNRKRETNM